MPTDRMLIGQWRSVKIQNVVVLLVSHKYNEFNFLGLVSINTVAFCYKYTVCVGITVVSILSKSNFV